VANQSFIVEFYKSNANGDLVSYLGNQIINAYSSPGTYNQAFSGAAGAFNAGDRIAMTVTSVGNSLTAGWVNPSNPGVGTSQASYGIVTLPPCCNNFLSLVYSSGVNCVMAPTGIGTNTASLVSNSSTASNPASACSFPNKSIFSGGTLTTCTSESMILGVNIGATCSCPSNLTYAWDFGDGYTTSGANASHSYSAGGTYTLTVTASSSTGGCTPETFTATVNVLANCCSQTPSINVFSLHKKIGPYCIGDALHFQVTGIQACSFDPSIITGLWSFGDGSTSTQGNVTHAYSAPGTYNISLTLTNPLCSSTPSVFNTTIQITDCAETVLCQDCIGSFAPPPGDYIISLWVKEEQSTTYLENYLSGIAVACLDGGSNVIGSTMVYNGTTPPVFKMIDGWQKIEQKFTIPSNAAFLQLSLVNNSNPAVDAYFDDIRVHPFNSSFKSYVYDPITLRLMAELDENNYATFYEYDEDGALIRVKKETEKGIQTIKEARNNVKK
jgi:PKD repeat protein